MARRLYTVEASPEERNARSFQESVVLRFIKAELLNPHKVVLNLLRKLLLRNLKSLKYLYKSLK
jgi:hypothetical protein